PGPGGPPAGSGYWTMRELRGPSLDLQPYRLVVGGGAGHVDPALADAVGEAAGNEAVIEILADVGARRLFPGIRTGRVGAEMGMRIEWCVGARRAAVIDVLQADHGEIFRALRQRVEVAHDDEVVGVRQVGETEFARSGHGAAFGAVVRHPLL